MSLVVFSCCSIRVAKSLAFPMYNGIRSSAKTLQNMLHDENLAYAQRLKECGVQCEVYTVPGGFHGFDEFAPEAPVSKGFRESEMSALIAQPK